ncbi:MAG: hypothetical protein DMH00_12640 [Acidobacteria bacterium]|nr:MAG: hypothetical protein DMH00_12640 [Acidobacteriota bacterium]
MAMRETVGSMRAYFVLGGMLGLLMNARLLLAGKGNLIILVLCAIGTIAAGAFVWIGVLLPKLVSSKSQLVPRVLLATGAYLGLLLLLGMFLGRRGICYGCSGWARTPDNVVFAQEFQAPFHGGYA